MEGDQRLLVMDVSEKHYGFASCPSSDEYHIVEDERTPELLQAIMQVGGKKVEVLKDSPLVAKVDGAIEIAQKGEPVKEQEQLFNYLEGFY